MKTPIFLLVLSSCLIACGGNDNESNDREHAQTDYLSYMKTAYSDYLGKNSDVESENRHCAACTFAEAFSDNNSTEQSGYSTTNVQIQGVDEADFLKFDGHVLQSLNHSAYHNPLENNPLENNQSGPKVRIFSGAMLAGEAAVNDDYHFDAAHGFQYTGILSHAEHSALVGYSSRWFGWQLIDDIASSDIACFADCEAPSTDEVIAYTWQYAQDGQPLIPEPNEIRVEGSLIESRVINGKLYLITQHHPHIALPYAYPYTDEQRDANQAHIDALVIDDLVPTLSLNNNRFPLFSADTCRIGDLNDTPALVPSAISITVVDLQSPTRWSSNCYVGNVSQAFVSNSNVYLSRWHWHNNGVEIIKYALTENGAEYRASGLVSGSLGHDSYRFGEVNGNLAFVNTVYDTHSSWWGNDGRHQLTVLEESDGDLNILAQIPNENQPAPIGKPGEQIYSVRFMGERAYVVTFDKVDPLYVIDLSNTAAPEILGELEIPGFSSYLHVINENLVLGIGKNAEEENGTTWFQGLNIRLFDVSNPSTPLVLSDLSYGLRGSDTEVFSTPHAFSFVHNTEQDTFRFALPMNLHGNADAPNPDVPSNTYYDWSEGGLYQFEVSLDNTPAIQEVARYLIDTPETIWWTQAARRSVIDDDTVYFSHKGRIDVLGWGTNEAIREFEND